MLKATYQWKRFLRSREGSFSLADGGYLYDPDSEYGRYFNPDVVSFEAIAGTPCLILLGEPGIGKSHAMQADRAAIEAKVSAEGGKTLWLDLGSYTSEDRLVADLFRGEAFQSWADGSFRLHLFLDSLDECRLWIKTVSSILSNELKRYPVERLHLRIACRTADWPASLEDALTGWWGDGLVAVYELVPLRRDDVAEAARTQGVDPEALLAEIDRASAVPLAIKPITLDFLLRTFRSEGRLPSTQAELYEEGCRILCEEPNEERRDARPIGSLSGRQRMAVAARIAGLTTFGNGYAVWNDVDLGAIPDGCVSIAELSGGNEDFADQPVEVTEVAVKEALSTGLFSSRGTHRMGWAHQTYAEFLAAWYLRQHNMPLGQITSLIVHASDPEGKLVPQLHETAAWLAGMVPAIFREVMEREPEALLQSDVASANEQDRARLVATLLRAYDEARLFDPFLVGRERYRRLNHRGLADQLKPYVQNQGKKVATRITAIDVARACRLKELQADLAAVALDPSEPIAVREHAAWAVADYGDDDAKAKLEPLVASGAESDPDDELKAAALHALWPGQMTAGELFAVLAPPRRMNLAGMYLRFLDERIVPALRPSDLPIALNWLACQDLRRQWNHRIDDLVADMLLTAWEHLDQPGVLDAFAAAVIPGLRDYEGIVGRKQSVRFNELLAAEPQKRRMIAAAILSSLEDPVQESVWLLWSPTPFLRNDDLPWLIDRLQGEPCGLVRKGWARLIDRATDWQRPDQVEIVFRASEDSADLLDEVRDVFEPVELDSPRAQKARANYQKMREAAEGVQAPQPLKPSPAERVAELLNDSESGNISAWWQLNWVMLFEPDGRPHHLGDYESDLTALPGWHAGDSQTRQRIVEAAKRYVLYGEPETDKWLGQGLVWRPAYAGYRALLLLLGHDRDFLATLDPEVWRKWAPIILAYPHAERETRHSLVDMAYPHARDEIAETLLVMIDRENAEGEHLGVLDHLGDSWDDDLGLALLKKAKERTLKPTCMAEVLALLLRHEMTAARAFAESLIKVAPKAEDDDRARAIIAARALMTQAADAGWPAVWPAFQQDPEFGREVVSGIADESDRLGREGNVARRLTEAQLGDLYIWLVQQYPYAEDRSSEGGGWGVSPRRSIAMWRESLLGALKQRGTPESSAAVARISAEFPEEAWLKRVLQEARGITRQRTWIPPRPADILRMAVDQESRLVQSGEQLLDVLIESLGRLEDKLQGETPARIYLWNEWSGDAGPAYRPKREEDVADYVKIHLDDDLRGRGIVINREVRIHRRERTDVHVDAIIRGPKGELVDSVKTVVEVKPCWNRDLRQAMETQLAGRYLRDTDCQHGLYLVPWFGRERWDDGDYRKGQVPEIDIDEAQREFDAQAAELSQQGVRIKALVIDASLKDKSNPSPSLGEQGR